VAEGSSKKKNTQVVVVYPEEMVKIYKETDTQNLIIEILFYRITSETGGKSGDMDIKIAACMSKVVDATYAKIEIVKGHVNDIISAALKGLNLHDNAATR